MTTTLDLTTVGHVYSGKAGKCMCGCSGTHRYAAAYREAGSKARGYAVDDEDINDRQVTEVCGLLQATFESTPHLVHDEGDCVWTEVNGRIYAGYRLAKA